MRVLIQLLVFCVGLAVSGAFAQKEAGYSPNGGTFTPRGTVRALVVFVVFKDGAASNPKFRNSEQPLTGWAGDRPRGLPDAVDPETGACPELFFGSEAELEARAYESGYNWSKDFYLGSLGRFRFLGEVFRDSAGRPTAVEIDATYAGGFTHTNQLALQAMQELNPRFDLSRFDLRKDAPYFRFDNSDTATHRPDGCVDYIIFIYRYQIGWAQQPNWSIPRWPGAGGGFAGVGLSLERSYNGYRFREGFTMVHHSGVFVHELAHTLFNAPHTFGGNHVVGEYWQVPAVGWGSIFTIGLFRGFNAWERWYLGYTEPPHVRADSSTPAEGLEFVLRDHLTTGDALRVEIPFSNGQWLWLENHAKKHPLDAHIWAGQRIDNDELGDSPAGVYAYTEAVAGNRQTIVQALSGAANGMKPYNAAGNFDYELRDEPPARNAWGNPLYKFSRRQPNPLAGTNPFYEFRADLDGDGQIRLDKNYNNAKNEGANIVLEEVAADSFVRLYAGFGFYNPTKNEYYSRSPAFEAGDVLDLNSNPMVTNHARYIQAKAALEPLYINGLEIRFLRASAPDQIKVRVRYGQTELRKSVRWCGNLVLPDLHRGEKPDLQIRRGGRLWLDKSGTANRHLKTEAGDFINPTILRIAAGARLRVERRGRLHLSGGSKIVVEKGGKIELEKGAKLRIDAGCGVVDADGNPLDLAH